mmetsp:Transcript_33163/g.65072  ORF Transcript_33163/g.65072 Transcript_33163/m.65072 type:complete len:291 (-) Transcript_33163:338-1210(-)
MSNSCCTASRREATAGRAREWRINRAWANWEHGWPKDVETVAKALAHRVSCRSRQFDSLDVWEIRNPTIANTFSEKPVVWFKTRTNVMLSWQHTSCCPQPAEASPAGVGGFKLPCPPWAGNTTTVSRAMYGLQPLPSKARTNKVQLPALRLPTLTSSELPAFISVVLSGSLEPGTRCVEEISYCTRSERSSLQATENDVLKATPDMGLTEALAMRGRSNISRATEKEAVLLFLLLFALCTTCTDIFIFCVLAGILAGVTAKFCFLWSDCGITVPFESLTVHLNNTGSCPA